MTTVKPNQDEAMKFVRDIFQVPDDVTVPDDATFYIKAEMELYPPRVDINDNGTRYCNTCRNVLVLFDDDTHNGADCDNWRYDNFRPIPGRESDVWRNDDEGPEESDWCGRDQMVHSVGIDHHGASIVEVYWWAQENCLDDPECWSTENGGMLCADGIHPAVNAVDLHPMDWNIGGISPVFVADVWIAAE